MAEAIFRKMVAEENLSDYIHIDSAGTGSWHIGASPHEGTRGILDEKDISYEGQKARQVHVNDWDTFDYIIAMDDQNMKDLNKVRQADNHTVVKKLLDFIPHPEETNVPDPYFTGDFNYTYELVSKGCKHLLQYIKEQHYLN